MKRYRLKPRFYVITISAGLIVAGLAINHIDKVCSERVPMAVESQVYREYIHPEEPEEAEEPALEYMGEYKVTHYCSCEECCGKTDGITFTGTAATEGRTVAVDPKVIPLGSEVVLNGESYIAEDIGGAIKGNRIDVYVGSHEEAKELGVYYAPVYMEG